MSSYNWSHIDEEAMKKADPEKYRRWRILAIIESDFINEKLDKEEVKAAWTQIKDQMDPWTRRALEYLLWGKRYSLPNNLTWWNKRPEINEYDYPQVEKSQTFGRLKIDSVYDIAINKLESICNRTKARDYVDLYMLISQNIFSMEQLMMRVPEKFGYHWTIPQYIRAFLASQETTDYPTMLVPFDQEKMIDFFLSEAKKLEKKIFK